MNRIVTILDPGGIISYTSPENSKQISSLNVHSFKYLDGLRGLAALAVVFSHLFLWFLPALTLGSFVSAHHRIEVLFYQLPINIFWNGNFAVCIFFVLSGFVLTAKFFASKDLNILVSGAIRRYPRLMIPSLVSVLIAYICVSLGLFLNHQGIVSNRTPQVVQSFWTHTGGFWAALYQGSIGIFTRQVDWSQQFNPALWTMYAEFIGSFLVFGLAALFGRSRFRYIVYSFLFLVLNVSFLTGFVIGMLLSDLYASTNRKRIFRPRFTGIASVSIGIIFGTVAFPTVDVSSYSFLGLHWALRTQVVQGLHLLAAGLIIYGILSLRALQKALSLKPIWFLGRISFSLYLIHTFVIASVGKSVFAFLNSHGLKSYGLTFFIVASVSIFISVCLAWLFTKYIDQPAIRFSRQFSNYWLNKDGPGLAFLDQRLGPMYGHLSAKAKALFAAKS